MIHHRTQPRIPVYLIFLLVGVLCLSEGFDYGQSAPDPWLILADGETGPINGHTTFDDLVRQYGAKNVVEKDIDIGEGETETGSVVFPDDPEQTLEILWTNPQVKNSLKSVTIHGQTSRWKAVHGISLGTTLKDLETLNGKPFELFGFDWDYSGTVYSWQGGALERELPHMILRVGLTPGVNAPEELSGDSTFSSHHVLMQKLNPRVYEIVWTFGKSTQGRKNRT